MEVSQDHVGWTPVPASVGMHLPQPQDPLPSLDTTSRVGYSLWEHTEPQKCQTLEKVLPTPMLFFVICLNPRLLQAPECCEQVLSLLLLIFKYVHCVILHKCMHTMCVHEPLKARKRGQISLNWS